MFPLLDKFRTLFEVKVFKSHDSKSLGLFILLLASFAYVSIDHKIKVNYGDTNMHCEFSHLIQIIGTLKPSFDS